MNRRHQTPSCNGPFDKDPPNREPFSTAKALSTTRGLVATALLVLAFAAPALAQVIGDINTPAANATVGQPFTISGWTLDAASGSGTGVDAVDVWGCPVLNCSTPSYWGAATYGLSRPDVAAWLGNQFLYSGYSFVMSGLTPGAQYYAKVFARRASTQQWTEFTVQFTATATPILVVQTPGNQAAVTQPFQWMGWAIDGSAPTGTGISLIDLYTYPNPGSGAAAVYLGSGGYGVARSDVAAAYGSRFLNSGYSVSKSGLTPGEHQFITYAYSPTNGWTVNARTTYVDIPTVTLTIDRNGTGTGAVTAAGLSCAGGASTQAQPCSKSYAHNTVVTLTAVPDSGSAFGGWSGGGCSGFQPCQITMSNAKFVSAMFTKGATGFTVSYYHTDRIGSVRAMTDAVGDPIGPRHDYGLFGEDTQALAGNPMRFGGKELDAETAFHYFEARYYRQTWGRFTQVDPAGGWRTDPQSWNRYAYARNNPLKFVDPTGRSYWLCVKGCSLAHISWETVQAYAYEVGFVVDGGAGFGYFWRHGDNVGSYSYQCTIYMCEGGGIPAPRPLPPMDPDPVPDPPQTPPDPEDPPPGPDPCEISKSSCEPPPAPPCEETNTCGPPPSCEETRTCPPPPLPPGTVTVTTTRDPFPFEVSLCRLGDAPLNFFIGAATGGMWGAVEASGVELHLAEGLFSSRFPVEWDGYSMGFGMTENHFDAMGGAARRSDEIVRSGGEMMKPLAQRALGALKVGVGLIGAAVDAAGCGGPRVIN